MGRHRPSRQAGSINDSSRRHIWIPAVLCALLTLVAACLVLPAQGMRNADDGLPTAADSSPDATTTWVPTTPDPEVGLPSEGPTGRTAVSVSIPSIGVDKRLGPVGS